MNEELKRRAEALSTVNGICKATAHEAAGVIRDLLAECERAKVCAICAGPITEQPKPEPVAWLVPSRGVFNSERAASASWKYHGSRNDERPCALYTAPPAPRVPKGYALVPIEPTPEMMDAVYAAAGRGQLQGQGRDQTYRRVYRAMVRAVREVPRG